MTQKQKIQQFDTVARKRDLLERYFWDSRGGPLVADAKYSARVDDIKIRFAVYRVDAAHGGYIIIDQTVDKQDAGASIEYWESYCAKIDSLAHGSDYTLTCKLAVEHLRGAIHDLRESKPEVAQ